ncbi:methyltransferase [Actinophytocola oryzae]|uniref:O-methyltransferase n=1 Tax=Actinophytocola oryzae TaxID=502181 RepID=A0A4R7W4W1_9PSEU|nr:methyltransferase [Actinophytocola oryzae]TDV57582.1 O-methyltransferase [Actinophytocola oryzae]
MSTATTSPAEIGAAVRQILGDALGYLLPAALRVAASARIAEHLSDGPLTPEQLAERSGTHADHLRRVLRFLATRDVFREDEEGRFHLTTAASVLKADFPVSMRNIVLLFTDDMYWKPAGRLDESVLRGNSVFDKVFDGQIFEHLPSDADATRLFVDAMADMSVLEHDGMAESYEFPESGTVVDVAGGLGGMLRAVLTRNPGLRGVLVDRAEVLARHRLEDETTTGRWETAEADFFKELPAGGDIYLLKRIIHDKSDEDAVRILTTVREAMSASSKLLIFDLVAPPGGIQGPSIMSDVLMMAVFEGKERTEAELTELLSKAGLKLSRILPTPSNMSVTEAVLAD